VGLSTTAIFGDFDDYFSETLALLYGDKQIKQAALISRGYKTAN